MLNLPEAAIGAIAAALIAGIVSLLGLTISKDQKTSEFRQAWIDALRADLSAYLVRINAIQDAVKVKYESHASKLASVHPHYILLNASTFNIFLRVNPKENRTKELLRCMNKFHSLMQDESEMIPSKIRPIEMEMLAASQNLLKAEWRRVKLGEWTYRVWKIAALILILSSLVLIGWSAKSGWKITPQVDVGSVSSGASSGPTMQANEQQLTVPATTQTNAQRDK